MDHDIQGDIEAADGCRITKQGYPIQRWGYGHEVAVRGVRLVRDGSAAMLPPKIRLLAVTG